MRRVTGFALLVSAIVGVLLLPLLPRVLTLAARAYASARAQTFVRTAPPKQASFTLPNGGIVRVSGTEVAMIIGPALDRIPNPVRIYVWHARYQAPSTTSNEFIGMWQGRSDLTRGYVVGDRIVIIPEEHEHDFNAQHIFIRSRAGRWRDTRLHFDDLRDGFDPPLLTSAYTGISTTDLEKIAAIFEPRTHGLEFGGRIESFSADRGELVLRGASPRTKGHVTLRLSNEGDAWQLAGIELDSAPTASH